MVNGLGDMGVVAQEGATISKNINQHKRSGGARRTGLLVCRAGHHGEDSEAILPYDYIPGLRRGSGIPNWLGISSQWAGVASGGRPRSARR